MEKINVICIDNSDTDLELLKIYEVSNSLIKDDKYIINGNSKSLYFKKSKFKKIRNYRINKLI